MIWQLKARLKKAEQENLALRKQVAEFRDKLIKCIGFFKNLTPEISLPAISLISKVTTTNECLREALNSLKTPVRVCSTRHLKAKSFDGIESDEEGSDNINTAVKLLSIKYHFERQKERSLNKQPPKSNNQIPDLGKEEVVNNELFKVFNSKGNADSDADEISVESQKRLSSYSF